MMLDFDAILGTWLAAGSPLLDFQSAQQERRGDKEVVSDACWASCVLRCPKRHALERLRVPAVYPAAQEHSLGLQLRFHHATMVEHAWVSALACSHDVLPSHPVRAQGYSGVIDAYLALYQAPVEIKASANKLSPGYFRQIVAYMYMLSAPTGYLVLDHQDGAYDAVRVEMVNGRYTAYDHKTSELYQSNRQPFYTSEWDMADLARKHATAYAAAGLSGQLAAPTKYQCLKIEDGRAVPLCPWFCWEENPGVASWPVEQGRLLTTTRVLPILNGVYG